MEILIFIIQYQNGNENYSPIVKRRLRSFLQMANRRRRRNLFYQRRISIVGLDLTSSTRER